MTERWRIFPPPMPSSWQTSVAWETVACNVFSARSMGVETRVDCGIRFSAGAGECSEAHSHRSQGGRKAVPASSRPGQQRLKAGRWVVIFPGSVRVLATGANVGAYTSAVRCSRNTAVIQVVSGCAQCRRNTGAAAVSSNIPCNPGDDSPMIPAQVAQRPTSSR